MVTVSDIENKEYQIINDIGGNKIIIPLFNLPRDYFIDCPTPKRGKSRSGSTPYANKRNKKHKNKPKRR